MFKVGENIIYGTQVCKISDKRDLTFGKVTRNYYILTPIFDQKNVIYLPADNEKLMGKMRATLSRQQIAQIIADLPHTEALWIEDDRERTAVYKAIIEKGDRGEIAKVIKGLYQRKKELESKSRKLHAADEILFSRAEKMLYEEIALALDIEKEDVVPFIAKQVEENHT
jgi:CarD family transcriptional regulator